MAYRIDYSREADLDIAWLPRNEQVLLRAAVGRLLRDEPDVSSSKRKKLDPNPFGADWEVRQGDLRAFYTVDGQRAVVQVVRAGAKRGNDLYVRGQKTDLRAQP